MSGQTLQIDTNKVRSISNSKFKIVDYVIHRQTTNPTKYFSLEKLKFFNSKDQEKHGDIRIRFGSYSNGNFKSGNMGSPIIPHKDFVSLIEKAKKSHIL